MSVEECGICLRPLLEVVGSETAVSLRIAGECGHMYHTECIKKHIEHKEQGDEEATCPLCRNEIYLIRVKGNLEKQWNNHNCSKKKTKSGTSAKGTSGDGGNAGANPSCSIAGDLGGTRSSSIECAAGSSTRNDQNEDGLSSGYARIDDEKILLEIKKILDGLDADSILEDSLLFCGDSDDELNVSTQANVNDESIDRGVIELSDSDDQVQFSIAGDSKGRDSKVESKKKSELKSSSSSRAADRDVNSSFRPKSTSLTISEELRDIVEKARGEEEIHKTWREKNNKYSCREARVQSKQKKEAKLQKLRQSVAKLTSAPTPKGLAHKSQISQILIDSFAASRNKNKTGLNFEKPRARLLPGSQAFSNKRVRGSDNASQSSLLSGNSNVDVNARIDPTSWSADDRAACHKRYLEEDDLASRIRDEIEDQQRTLRERDSTRIYHLGEAEKYLKQGEAEDQERDKRRDYNDWLRNEYGLSASSSNFPAGGSLLASSAGEVGSGSMSSRRTDLTSSAHMSVKELLASGNDEPEEVVVVGHKRRRPLQSVKEEEEDKSSSSDDDVRAAKKPKVANHLIRPKGGFFAFGRR